MSDDIKDQLKKIRETRTKLISNAVEISHLSERLKEEKDIFYFLAEHATDGFWDRHLKTDFEYMSSRLWETFGYDPAEKTHSPSEWMDIIHPDDKELVFANAEKHFESKGQFPYDQEIRYFHKDGSIVWVRCRGKVVKWDKDGKPERMVGTHTDITKFKEKEFKLIERELKLIEREASVAILEKVFAKIASGNEQSH